MGRNAEVEIMAQIKEMLANHGVKKISARYIKTAKNSPVENLFEKLGFETTTVSKEGKEYEARISSLPSSTCVFKEVITEF